MFVGLHKKHGRRKKEAQEKIKGDVLKTHFNVNGENTMTRELMRLSTFNKWPENGQERPKHVAV
jgi:hypothetical protein